jgi:hypothetical protein
MLGRMQRSLHNLVLLFGMRFLTHLRVYLLNRKNSAYRPQTVCDLPTEVGRFLFITFMLFTIGISFFCHKASH